MEKLLVLLAALPFGLGFALVGESAVRGEVVFAFQDPEIIESSGLLVQDGFFATVNDSGDSARLFTVDPATGATVGTTEWDAEADDFEAIAPLENGDVLVGDIGDNLAQRDSIEITRVPMGDSTVVTDPASYELVYPDGSRDAEAVLVHPQTGQVLIASKEFIGRMYAAPERLDEAGPNRLEELGDVMPIVTDGAFFPDGKHLVLRGYGSATFYTYPGLREVGELDLPDQDQGEGIAIDEDGEVYISSEGQFSEVMRVALPEKLRAEVDGTGDQADQDGGEVPDDGEIPEGGGDVDDPVDDRPLWPWLVGGAAGAVIIVVLLRALRPR